MTTCKMHAGQAVEYTALAIGKAAGAIPVALHLADDDLSLAGQASTLGRLAVQLAEVTRFLEAARAAVRAAQFDNTMSQTGKIENGK